MLRVALKSILARKRRLFTTGFAIVLSVAFISGTLVITALIDSTLGSLIGSSYQGIDAVVRSTDAQESRFGQPIRKTIPLDTLDLVRSAKGVRAAEGLVQGLPTIIDKDGERIQDTFGPPSLAFNWTDDEELAGGRLAKGGRPPKGPDEVVLDVRTAKEFKFRIGDEVQIQFAAGLRTFRLVGIGGIQSEGQTLTAGPRIVLLDLPTAQELFNKKDGYDYIAVGATEGVSERDLVRTLRKILPPDHEAITGEKFIEESEAAISTVISLFTQPILAFGFIAMFVGAFVIYNTFSIVVAQRTRELALLRAVGAGRRQVMGSVVLEALIVGVVAAAIGIAFGWGLAVVLKGALAAAFALPEGVPPLTGSAVLWALVIGVGSTVISALIPAVRATFIPPVAALGNVAIDRSNLSMGRRIVGTILLVAGVGLIVLVTQEVWDLGLVGIGIGAGLLFLAIATLGPVFAGPLARTLGAWLPRVRGVAGRIGKENAGRNPKRTAITAAALSIGVSLVAIVSIFATSIRGATDAQLSNQLSNIDLVIDSGTGFAGLGPDAAPYLRERSDVAAINPIRFSLVTLLDTKGAKEEQQAKGKEKNGVPVGEPDFMIGVDPTAVFEIVTFDGLEPKIDRLPDDEVLVLSKVAEENGWKPGDRVRMWFPTTGEQRWKIAAVFTTRVGSGAAFIANSETLSRNSTAEFNVDSTIWVKLKDGVNVEKAKRSIADDLKKLAPSAGVNTVGDYLGERLAIVDSVVNLIYVLLGLSIVIALVGVGNTISLSIYERTRELGLVRAVGMTRRQVGESVLWESVIISLAGTVLGLAVGIVLAIVFVNALDEQGVVPVVGAPAMVTIGVLGALAGVLTAIRPARRATRVDVLDAISSV